VQIDSVYRTKTYELSEFPSNARNVMKERKERNEMTSLLDKQFTAASDDGVCRWHTAKL